MTAIPSKTKYSQSPFLDFGKFKKNSDSFENQFTLVKNQVDLSSYTLLFSPVPG